MHLDRPRHTIVFTLSFLLTLLFASPLYALSPQDITVTVLQTFLEQKGFLVITANIPKGPFGSLTKQALIAYQTSANLPAQGVFGALTKASIAQDSSQSINPTRPAPSNTPPTDPTATVTVSQMNASLQGLRNSLMSVITSITAPSAAAPNINYSQMALANRIDQLANTAITTPTITNPTITGGSVSGTSITATSLTVPTLSATTGSFAGDLSVLGNLIVSGAQTL